MLERRRLGECETNLFQGWTVGPLLQGACMTGDLAQAAKELFAAHPIGVLSTYSAAHKEYPFGSLLPFDLDPQGRMTIYIATISEHYRNLRLDPRASILVHEELTGGEPQARSRATALLDMQPLPDSERDELRARFQRRFPSSVPDEIASQFVLLRGVPRAVRLIAGFGSMGWIDGAAFAAAPLSEIAAASYEIISHLQQDHYDALAALACAAGVADAARTRITVRRVHEMGLTLRAAHHHDIEVRFPRAAKGSDDFRQLLIAELQKVREASSQTAAPKGTG